MVKPAKKIIQSAVVKTLKNRNNLTNLELAQSIDVHRTHIQKVSRGKRLLSDRKFEELCGIWDVDLDDVINRLELDNQNYLRRKTLLRLMQINNYDLKDLSEITGIKMLKLNQIERGKRQPNLEEVKKLSKALNVDEQIIDEGNLAIALEMIKKSLEYMYIEPSAIEAVMDFIDHEL